MSLRIYGQLKTGVVVTTSNTKTLICWVEVPVGARCDMDADVSGKNTANVAQGSRMTRSTTTYNVTGTPAVVDTSTAGLLSGVLGILAAALSPFLGASLSFEAMAGTNQVGLYVTPGAGLGALNVEWSAEILGKIN